MAVPAKNIEVSDESRQQLDLPPALFGSLKDSKLHGRRWSRKPTPRRSSSRHPGGLWSGSAFRYASSDPYASAVELAIAELPKTKARTSIDLSMSHARGYHVLEETDVE